MNFLKTLMPAKNKHVETNEHEESAKEEVIEKSLERDRNQLTPEETQAFQKLVDDNLNSWYQYCRYTNTSALFISFTRPSYDAFKSFIHTEEKFKVIF